MSRALFFSFLLAAVGCGSGSSVRRPFSAGRYVYTPPEVVKKDTPAVPTRAILFPFRDKTTKDSKISKNAISLNFLKGGHEKIPQVTGETLSQSWGAFLQKSGTFEGIGYSFGDDQDRRGRVGLGGSVIQAQYLIEDPVCLLRIRVVFEARKSGGDKPIWRDDIFESGKCNTDFKNAKKQHEALDTLFHALFTRALKSLEVGLDRANITDDDVRPQIPGEEKPPPPKKKVIGNESVVDELYRRALQAQ